MWRLILLFILLLGAIIGSFIGAYTYRYPRNISISKGRSKCPKCKKQIEWYDNIPILSFVLLSGKCRHCKKKISFRYPIIEVSTSLVFGLIAFLARDFGLLQIMILLFIAALLVCVFVTDWENRIISDEVIFLGFIANSILLLLSDDKNIFMYLLSGFGSALFLLIVNLATRGKGMGLGDVKLALFIGSFLGIMNSFMWLSVSFMIGGIFGVFVLLFGKMKLKQEVPFGPFLIIGLIVILLFGVHLKKYVNFGF